MGPGVGGGDRHLKGQTTGGRFRDRQGQGQGWLTSSAVVSSQGHVGLHSLLYIEINK